MKVPLCALILVTLLSFHACHAQTIDLTDLQARVAKGDPDSELELGRLYHKGGHGVTIDFAKAADLYREAAAQGNAKAMYNLGYIYHHAQGVPLDDATATQWFRKAADKQLPAAEFQMGFAYFTGTEGCPQDYAQSIKWLTLAAQQPDKAAQPGRAASFLGLIYKEGLGTPKNNQQAVFWFTIGAEAGDAKAQFNLGSIYLQGLIAKQDTVQAYKWLKLAAARGEPLATHLFAEEQAANAFSPQTAAEGDRQVNDYQVAHHGSVIGQLPMVADPQAMPLPPVVTNAASAKPPGN